jgi:hypothetical protein
MIKRVLIVVLLAVAASTQTKVVGPSKLGPGSYVQAPQVQVCYQQFFGKTVNCSLTVTNGWTIVAEGFNAAAVALNTPTAGCTTFTAQTGTTTTDGQVWSIGTATSTGSCTVTQTTTDASNVEMGITVFALSPLVTNGTIDATVTTSNYATGYHSSAFSGPSVTGVTNNDVYLATGYQNGGGNSLTISSANMPCTSDNSQLIGGAGDLWMAQGHCTVATAGAKAPGWSVGQGGQTYATATIALQP